MGLGKQAKILSNQQQATVLQFLETTRNPTRNKVIFLLSLKAGLRAKEIANLTWGMVTGSDGKVGQIISLTDKATKGRSGGVVWMNKALRSVLVEHWKASKHISENDFVVCTERRKSTTAQSVVNLFGYWYKTLGFVGCSSHSGRRTFITNAAKKISSVGGSMRDVQVLARHSSLNMTMRYIEADVEAMRKVVNLL